MHPYMEDVHRSFIGRVSRAHTLEHLDTPRAPVVLTGPEAWPDAATACTQQTRAMQQGDGTLALPLHRPRSWYSRRSCRTGLAGVCRSPDTGSARAKSCSQGSSAQTLWSPSSPDASCSGTASDPCRGPAMSNRRPQTRPQHMVAASRGQAPHHVWSRSWSTA